MKQALVLASFGVADGQARQNCLESLATAVAEAHPEYDFRQAYTSAFIRKRLEKEQVHIPSLAECLEGLADEGYERVLVQPSHLTPGEEYDNKILAAAGEFAGRFRQLLTGEPLFFREDGKAAEDDYSVGLDAVWEALSPAAEEVVLLGHGSPHRHNPVYEILQKRADEKGLSLHIGVVEEADTPDFSMVLSRLRRKDKRGVLLAPLLLSGGVHVTEDMAGDSPASWKSRLRKEGFSVRVILKGLGEYPGIRRLYLEKADRLVRKADEEIW